MSSARHIRKNQLCGLFVCSKRSSELTFENIYRLHPLQYVISAPYTYEDFSKVSFVVTFYIVGWVAS